MKIAFISTIRSYPWGGADAMWTAAAEAAQNRGDTLLLAVNDQVAAHPRIRSLLDGGAVRHRQHPPSPTLARRTLRKLRLASDRDTPLLRSLDKFRPDFVIISGGGTYDLVNEPDLWSWLQATSIPFNYLANWQEPRPVLSSEDRAIATARFEAAQSVFFVSPSNLLTTRRHLLAPLAHARILQYPLRAPSSSMDFSWPASPPFKLAAVARLEPVKGLDLLLHAVHLALSHIPDWTLDLYGSGPDEAYLNQIILHYNLADRVHLRGYVADIDSIWRDHHLLLSTATAEGVPLTIPEAMLRARPVLATRVGGAEDWITHGVNGFICDAPTPELIARALTEAWSRRSEWSDFGTLAAEASSQKLRPTDYLNLLPHGSISCHP
jgi:glycosyltransferase involved in cell wall biosynthesis